MAKKVKETVTKGVAKVPLVMQLESLECGAASLTMVMAYYSLWVPLEQVREDTAISRDGSSAKNILAAARKYGFVTKGYALSTEKLRQIGKFPCIIHWNRAHFVVLCGFKGKKAIINDPAKGIVKMPIKDFDKCFTGIYLEIVPGEDFVPGGKRKSILAFAKKRLVGCAPMITFFVISTLVTYLTSLFDPQAKEYFVNNILGNQESKKLLPFIAVVGGVGLFKVIVTLIQQIFTYKINGKLAIESNSTFMWKVLRLPISFFSQRMVGDIEQRKDSNATIASTLVNTFAPMLLNFGILIVYFVFMIQKSYILTLVGVSMGVANIFISQAVVKRRINISRVYARDNAMLSAATSKGIEMIETIKSSGAEAGYFSQWSDYKKAVTANKLKLTNINGLFGAIPTLISNLINLGITFLGVYLTMIGEYTIGAIVGFQGLLSAFMSPVSGLIDSSQQIQEMRTEMERVDDVMEYPDDPNVSTEIAEDKYHKLNPNIEIKNLTFGYNKLADPLIKNFNLSVKSGSSIAIVGGSGCGKSTLAKLIAGLYVPWEGEILFNGKRMNQIDRDVFTSSVSVVDQEIILFEDTVANNIKMWDDTIEDFEMILAANDACIHDTIIRRPGGYQFNLLEGGKNLSGGERQRIEIARALAKDPSVLILDEATSALDAKTEYEIIKAIERRGITCIVVAHRLSSIRHADKIIVLDKGEVIEVGNHEELMKKQGYYYNLISNE